MISVVIPVKNGGRGLRRCLGAVVSQEIDDVVEIVVVDSGSTDGSVDVARDHGAQVIEIPPERFTHGGSRNLGALKSRGETLVFLSQDAYPASDTWLHALCAPLGSDLGLAGVYGRQLPHPGSTPPEEYFLSFLYGAEPRVQSVRSDADLSMRTTLFSNVNAALLRRVWEEFPFAEDIIMSEDQDWCARVLRAGWSVRYEPAAAVWHSHRYTFASAMRRFFDSGVSAERTYLVGKRPASRVLRSETLEYALDEVAWLRRTHHLRWLPYVIVYEAAKFVGLQLGIRHRYLPRKLKLRLSSHKGYWQLEPRTEDG